MNIKQLVTHACSLSALLAVSACNNSTPTGALVVPFQIGAGVECSARNVEKVTVTLVEPMTAATVEAIEVDEATVDCAAGEALFTAVEVGTYNVRVEGTDPNGTTVVDNVLTYETDVAEVLDGQETRLSRAIRMASTPAEVQVRWSFSGFVTQCTQIPIAKFEIIASKNDGTDILLVGEFACDSVADGEDSYHILQDPMRVINGSELDTIEITALDATGNPIDDTLVYNLVEVPGAGQTVKLTFRAECTADSCEVTCNEAACQPD